MERIYRLKDRLEFLGIKCDYCEEGTDHYQKAKFKEDHKLVPPKDPAIMRIPTVDDLPEDPTEEELKKHADQMESLEAYNNYVTVEYPAKLAEYEAELARVNALSARPDVLTILAVREEIGILDHLKHLVDELVPNANASYFEDDYYAIDWKDERPKPLLADLITLETKLSYHKKVAKYKAKNNLADIKAAALPEDKRTDLLLGRLPPAEIASINAAITQAEAAYVAQVAAIESATALEQLP